MSNSPTNWNGRSEVRSVCSSVDCKAASISNVGSLYSAAGVTAVLLLGYVSTTTPPGCTAAVVFTTHGVVAGVEAAGVCCGGVDVDVCWLEYVKS